MATTDPLLHEFQLKHIGLRNRILSTSHAPAFAELGHPRDRYRLYHEEKAKGGVALTMIGGSTNISPDSPSVFGQLYAGDDSIIPWFRKLTDGVKSHGASIMCQVTHMGRRTSSDNGHWLPVIGASNRRERAHRAFPKPMEGYDLRRVISHFADAALRCQQGGFDGIEILSHSHLLGQFLSPLINNRTDAYGGSLHNRLRLTMEVLDAIRNRVGDSFIVGIRMTGDELNSGGIDREESMLAASMLEQSGMLDFFNIVNGAPYDDLGLAHWVSPMGNPTPDDLDIVRALRAGVSLPVFHAGGIADINTARQAITSGTVDMIGMTRAHIADPYLVEKLESGKEEQIRPCVGLGYCVDRVNQGKDAVCGHNAASGREAYMSHVITRTSAARDKKVVIVGGGPAGMECARVFSERGFNVVLFEANNKLGGQLTLAAQSPLRRQIWGVAHWLQAELERLKVDIRYSSYAEKDEVVAEQPDLVVIATGGMPSEYAATGSELALSNLDVLAGNKYHGEVIVFDDHGDHQAAITAEVLATNGAQVKYVTPDRTALMELGPTNSSVVLKNLYRLGVEFCVLHDLVEIIKHQDRYRVTLRNTLTGDDTVCCVDHIVIEHGTSPLDDVYETLKPQSKNAGAIDISALAENTLNLPVHNHTGLYDLVRIGDAVSSRNLHAAIYDALRLGTLYGNIE